MALWKDIADLYITSHNPKHTTPRYLRVVARCYRIRNVDGFIKRVIAPIKKKFENN